MAKGIFLSSTVHLSKSSRRAKLFMAKFLQNEGNAMLVEVNEMQTLLKNPQSNFSWSVN